MIASSSPAGKVQITLAASLQKTDSPYKIKLATSLPSAVVQSGQSLLELWAAEAESAAAQHAAN